MHVCTYLCMNVCLYACMYACNRVFGAVLKCVCASKMFKCFEMFISCYKYTGKVDTTFSKYKQVTKSFIHHCILYLNFRNAYMFLNYRNRDK